MTVAELKAKLDRIPKEGAINRGRRREIMKLIKEEEEKERGKRA